uniref:Putative tyrosine-protein phosphatase non-receptor type 23 n=2 Tax=Nyssomyia neivai TaxID=330878 RepID=A0A1L8DJ58_9DIPT
MSQVINVVAILCLALAAMAQDYDEDYNYNSGKPRPAPIRLRQGNEPAPTPVPILKQINRHNEDGSYTYGYEGADGSFKIETKSPTGEVKGKYGYVDETGKVRVVEYGANKYGFQPSGEGITVAPPTLVDETTNKDGLTVDYEDEPQPQQKPYIARVARPQAHRPRPQPQQQQYAEYEHVQPQLRAQVPQQARPVQLARQHFDESPVPARAQISGAVPSSDVVYSREQRPARPDPSYSQRHTFTGFGAGLPSQPAPRVEYQEEPVYQQPQQPQQIQYSAPRAAAPHPNYRPQPSARSSSVLDQLAKDYALPQGGAPPLHDISFGYY